ncbi:MAG TPA: carboxypeptidase regulatory-like domain-containing protein [Gemmatimonas sp.]|nr:carboxypeptidase regulatory-like domain-containing protein [Gemmatimonas sp.]
MQSLLNRVVTMTLASAMLAMPAHAQNTITLEGSVKAEGAPVVAAQITVVNVSTNESLATTTRASGEFRVLGLYSGKYTVNVKVIGYRQRTDTVDLAIGQRARLEFTLERGAAELVAQTVTAERVKQVEVQRMSVSAPVMKEEIENLPLNSRGIMNLAGIAPGIKTYAPQSGRTLPSGGAAPDLRFFNVYMDGVEMKSLFNGNIVGLGQTGSPLPQEGLEQFRVYVNPYDAEFTRAGSYVISAESRRGTNKWQGSGFGFYQNNDAIARNAFQSVVPNFGRQQLGFNLRGPLAKDKLFIATSYELTSTDFFFDVNPTSGANWTQFRGSYAAPNRNHTAFTRLTYVQNPQITYDAMVSARFLRGEGNFGGRVSQDGGISQKYEIYTGQLRQRFLAKSGNFVNEASLQLVSWNHNEAPLTPGPQRTYPGIVFGTAGFPLILKETHLRLVDRATWTIDNAAGSHVIKAGFELSSIAATQNQPNNVNGTFNFPTDTSTLPNAASIAVGFTDPTGTSDAIADATGYTTGFYINDEWRIKPNFTLSLGLRHDAEFNTMNNDYTVPWASDARLKAIPALANFLNEGNRKNQLGNISPRVSFSWDPTRKNQTFLRGGFGIIYDRVTSFMGFQERRNSTWRTYNFVNPGTADPAVLRQRVIAGQSGSPAPILMKLDMKTPHSQQMSLGLGHQFTSEFGLNVDYVRQHMDNLYVQRNPNYVDRSVTPAVRKLTPAYGDIVLWDDIGQSDYSAVLVQGTWQRRRARVNVAYTLGWYQGDFDTAGLPNFTYNFLFNRQRTTGDERHRLVVSNLTPLPFAFMFSAVSTFASPRPFLSTDGRDQNLNNVFTDDFIGGTPTSTGNRTTRPANSWNNWYRTVDVRLARPLFTVNGTKVSASAEVFNLFNFNNTLSFGGTQFTTSGVPIPSFGRPTAAFAARQGQVGMRFEF